MRASSFFLLSMVLLSACVDRPLTIAQSAEALKQACNAACAGEPQRLVLSLPAASEIYTTQEAVCVKRSERLSCGTCSCATYGLEGGTLISLEAAGNVTCAFSDTGAMLSATCA